MLEYDWPTTDGVPSSNVQIMTYRAFLGSETKSPWFEGGINHSTLAHARHNLTNLGLLPVLQSQDEVEVGLVVHLTAVGQAHLEDSVDEGRGQGAGSVVQQLSLAQHPVVVLVQVQVLAYTTQGNC